MWVKWPPLLGGYNLYKLETPNIPLLGTGGIEDIHHLLTWPRMDAHSFSQSSRF